LNPTVILIKLRGCFVEGQKQLGLGSSSTEAYCSIVVFSESTGGIGITGVRSVHGSSGRGVMVMGIVIYKYNS